MGICDQHPHAECETEFGKALADRTIANDAERCSIELAAHPRFGNMPGAVYGSGLSDMAPAIDHEADCHFGDRSDEARRRAGDENTLGTGGVDIDVTNVHRDPQE